MIELREHHCSLALPPCPTCGLPMRLSGQRTHTETCLGWLGPHNPNRVTGAFACSAGHDEVTVEATVRYRCSCGWRGGD